MNSRWIARARARGRRMLPAIEAASGPSISTLVAAKRLKCSAAHVRSQIARGNLVAYEATSARKRYLLPTWQFADKHRVHPWVPELIKSYGSNGWALVNFVTAARAHLDGDSYLHLLRSGRVDEVLKAAARSNPD